MGQDHELYKHIVLCCACLFVAFSDKLPSKYHAPIPRVGMAIITPSTKKHANPSQVRNGTLLVFCQKLVLKVYSKVFYCPPRFIHKGFLLL